MLSVCNTVCADVDNPFGSNVIIFDPSMPVSEINNKILQIYNQQNSPANSYSVDFSDNRYAFIFMPGTYGTPSSPVDVRVGVYTSVIGAGPKPDDVVITGAVRTQDRPNLGGVTTVFWRSMENLAIVPTLGSLTDGSIPKNQNVWAVSQASPARRIHVKGDLRLNDVSWSSGGLLANSRIDGTVFSGTQQQYLTRNSQFKAWNGSNWNIVFVGITPGVYHLTDTINVTRPNTIIYGMGFPTFVSDTGKPIMSVND